MLLHTQFLQFQSLAAFAPQLVAKDLTYGPIHTSAPLDLIYLCKGVYQSGNVLFRNRLSFRQFGPLAHSSNHYIYIYYPQYIHNNHILRVSSHAVHRVSVCPFCCSSCRTCALREDGRAVQRDESAASPGPTKQLQSCSSQYVVYLSTKNCGALSLRFGAREGLLLAILDRYLQPCYPLSFQFARNSTQHVGNAANAHAMCAASFASAYGLIDGSLRKVHVQTSFFFGDRRVLLPSFSHHYGLTDVAFIPLAWYPSHRDLHLASSEWRWRAKQIVPQAATYIYIYIY